MDTGSVFSRPHRFIVLDALTAADSTENFSFLVGLVLRNKNRDWLTHNLLPRVAKQSFCCGIPTRHNAVQVLADNRILSRLNQRSKKRLRDFGFLPPPAFGDI